MSLGSLQKTEETAAFPASSLQCFLVSTYPWVRGLQRMVGRATLSICHSQIQKVFALDYECPLSILVQTPESCVCH